MAFLFRYIRLHPVGHAVVLVSVLLAVGCSGSTQYRIETSDRHRFPRPGRLARRWCGARSRSCAFWWRRITCCGGSPVSPRHRTFVAVTGDIRRDLFAYLSGHAPGYFAARLPGGLASRVSSTANNAFIVANTTIWSVIPPVVAVVMSIAFIGAVNLKLALGLLAVALLLGGVIFVLARRGTPLHQVYAEHAAGVDGELVDVISNFNVMRAFGATFREQTRLADTIGVEMASRKRSLYYMEKLRTVHAVLTALLTAGVVAAGIRLWLAGQATVGDIVLLTSLAFTILHATRDLAVSLVDVTQYIARLQEAIGALLLPQELADKPGARTLPMGPREVVFDDVSFAYPGRPAVLQHFNLTLTPGQRVGLVGYSGAGKSTVMALLQRFHDVTGGRILIDGYDIRDLTKDSLREAMALVPQDISLFHRTRAGEPVLRPPRRDRRGDARRRRNRALPRFHRGAAGRFRHRGRRSRRDAVGRPAPAAGDRPGVAEGRADPAAG